MSSGHLFLFAEGVGRVHFGLQDVLGQGQSLTIFKSSNYDVLIIDFLDLVICNLGEPVAFFEFFFVPSWHVIVWLQGDFSAGNLTAKRVLDVPEDNRLNGSMVNLSDIVISRSIQVNNH